MTWTTLLYLGLMTIAFGIGLVFIGIRPPYGDINFWDLAGASVVQLFIGFAAILPALMYASARVHDELLDVPIPPVKRLHGYMLLGFLLSGYFAMLSLPFVAMAFMFGGRLGIMLLGLVSTMLSGIVYNLLYLSFLNKVTNQAGLVVGVILLFTFGNLPFGLVGMTEALLILYLHFSATMTSAGFAPFATPPPFNPNSLALMIYAVLFTFVIGILAYWLCRRHLSKPFQSVWRELGVNLWAYTLTTAFFCATWLGLRLSGIVG